MNLKFLSFSAVALLATMVSAQRPECTVDVDTTACTTSMGNPGYFIHKVEEEETATSGLRAFFGGGRGGRGGGRGGRRGGRGLSSSKCVPVDAPERPERPVDDVLDGEDEEGDRPRPQMECGCDDVCPEPITCPCACDIALPYDTITKGSKAIITKKDGTTVTKCVPPMYADADKYTCVAADNCAVEVDTPFN